MARFLRLLVHCHLALGLALVASACGRDNEGALDVAIVGESGDLFQDGVLLPVAAQHVRAATTEGLVSLDAKGQVTPALADRWIITDDGRSYIFRLRDGVWPGGAELTGESARNALRRAVRRLAGTSLGNDIAQIAEIRAMAGRVVEIRLKGPMPDLLQLLAQPELGLTNNGRGTGPMTLHKENGTALLSMIPPQDRGLPMVEDWAGSVRDLRVQSLPAKRAIDLFYEGGVDMVLNGRIEALPLVNTGPLSRGTVRLDPALGLFGLAVRRADGFLSEPSGREAVSMAIDRDALLNPFNVGGWTATTRLVGPGLPDDLGTIGEQWSTLSIEERRASAAERVANWKTESGEAALEISVGLPEGPGSTILFNRLVADLQTVGITLRRARAGENADLELVDRVARYASPRWFLNQFNCTLRRGPCSSEADARVAEAAATVDPAERTALLAEAEAELTALNAYIPFAQPIRWSLVRAGIDGFSPNPWVFHPLPPLATITR